MKTKLIMGIILLLSCITLIIYFEVSRVNIYEITNSGQKKADKRVYLDATYIAGTITDNYYVMFGDGVQYIVYISDEDAIKINRYLLDNPESSYRIEGVTKLIPTSLEENGIKFVIGWLNHSHNHGEEESHVHDDITVDDFYHYFGYVYLDNTSNDNLVLEIIMYVFGITGLLLIINFLNTKYHFIN